MSVAEFIAEVQRIYNTGAATEHSYRAALGALFDGIDNDVTSVNEPKAVKVGRPDFVFLRNGEVTVGHCEAKDIGLDVSPRALKDANKAQHRRYVKALPNLIYTNCLDFHFYKNGELVREISIADFLKDIQPKPDQFEALANQLKDFAAERLQTITSSKRLAEMMAGKAALIKDVLGNSLKEDEDLQTELAGQYHAFKEQLIHDLTPEDFSDIYAETVAYGMFAARLHDETLDSFSREEALTLLPKSNPFLRNLFSYVAGPTLDERLVRTIDELADIFQATDLQKLFADFGKFTRRNDPFIHFYETFLAEYNPKKRKARGVWYTPEPVVNFIVRAVDDVLKTEFGLTDGLADTSKVTVDWDTGQTFKGKAVTEKKEVHRVQILDPATGTGTFLAEVIKQIAPKIKDVAPGMWSSYIEKALIPRIHGFELLMASYAMCHMKLDMMLTELGYKPSGAPPRLGVYLTNSLEEGEAANQTLPFAQWLSNEVREANTIKRDMPIMCVIGNPPYSGQSSNKGKWITELMEVYKMEPGGKQKLQERNPKWINNDYVKFIRMGEHLIEKNKEGILSYITSNSYLESPTFRGMRWYLLQNFDDIFILNLHGDSNIKEPVPENTDDVNVFDIMEGVSIIIACKRQINTSKKATATLSYYDMWGNRGEKYKSLNEKSIKTIEWMDLVPKEPYYFFKPRSFLNAEQFGNGFKLSEVFSKHSTGYYTSCDAHVIGYSDDDLSERLNSYLGTDHEVNKALYRKTTFRPLDNRVIYYDPKLLTRSRKKFVAKVGFTNKNLVLIAGKSTKNNIISHYFVSSIFSELKCAENTKGSYMNPLYLYPEEQDLDQTSRVNMDPKIRKQIEDAVMGAAGEKPDEVAIFDYIYGVLHCPQYRETYKEFLKIDFPRIPYPASADVFWDVSKKGTQLRRLHLMEDAAIGETPYPFDGEGDAIVDKPKFVSVDDETGSVFINKTHSFANVPECLTSTPMEQIDGIA